MASSQSDDDFIVTGHEAKSTKKRKAESVAEGTSKRIKYRLYNPSKELEAPTKKLDRKTLTYSEVQWLASHMHYVIVDNGLDCWQLPVTL